jgi:cytochrome c oxidase subunit 2
MRIVVETQEEFEQWMAEQKTFGETVLNDNVEPTPAFNTVEETAGM